MPKTAGEGHRVQQAEQARERVVARQAILKLEKIPEQCLPVTRELGKVDAALRAADRTHQRYSQPLQKLVPRRVPRPWIRQRRKAVTQQSHRPLPNSRSRHINPYPVAAEIAQVVKCNSPGSVGWCAMIATALSLNAGRLPPDVGRELAGWPADYRGAGSARAGGRAWEVSGGYRVQGRWNFAGGIQNANWLYCTCVMMNGDTPCRTASGAPLLRAAWVPREQVAIVDTWSVMGMRGTGSQDFTVDDVFVPARRSCLSDDPPAETGPLNNRRAWYAGVDTIGGECTGYSAWCDRQPCRDRRHQAADLVGASAARPADGAGPHR